MKIKFLISAIAVLAIAACSTILPEVPDAQKNCQQLGKAIEGVKEDIADKIPYDKIPENEDDVLEGAVKTAFMFMMLPVKEMMVSETEELKALTKRYRELMGYSYEKKCGFENVEVQSLIETFKKLKNSESPAPQKQN